MGRGQPAHARGNVRAVLSPRARLPPGPRAVRHRRQRLRRCAVPPGHGEPWHSGRDGRVRQRSGELRTLTQRRLRPGTRPSAAGGSAGAAAGVRAEPGGDRACKRPPAPARGSSGADQHREHEQRSGFNGCGNRPAELPRPTCVQSRTGRHSRGRPRRDVRSRWPLATCPRCSPHARHACSYSWPGVHHG